mmetsp:Transcript_67286/g.140561  ORF Transcript_67286/g.140561 Transcript_67286/m.140561 type:complete len:203 (-) Transcript_67286:249-857(-)
MNRRFEKIRREFLQHFHGDVLDVGCGCGYYLPYYLETRQGKKGGIRRAVMLEPNPAMREQLEAAAARARNADAGFEVEVRSDFIEEVQGDNQFDCVVFGNVLCEVPDQTKFLIEIGRLLKPGGFVFFSEHVGIQPKRSFWRQIQEFLNPFWCVFADGCNINRDTIECLQSQEWVEEVHTWGFDIEPPACKLEIGIATKTYKR